ncbi:helix-turn-helix domain-containing protein [Amycolatopsis rhizosphaerae]|uniref:Helix-turn-helix domain-containing protein n=1 Tax=Amycolatopsis rhizosphaerae TaxID=2053003 RepID=A0A558CCN6_9PSEU|nr:helix-turn-helix domain-containing protein [Amycolatopsis rhizosphaerae]TVT46535.1 helix-turn-helix domain-containing protein [Amycolatopsis rhizosphaerae]
MEAKPGVRAQTLDRALDVLDILADGQARSSHDLAAATGLHRSIVYRILRTLEDRELVRRTVSGRYTLGLGLLVLSRPVLGGAQVHLHEVLGELANRVSATAFFAVPRGDEVVTLVAVEPGREHSRVAYRPWDRAPMDRGSCGPAIRSASPAQGQERPEIAWARETGYVRTVGELHAGLTEIAAPVRLAHGAIGCVAVVFVSGELDEGNAAQAVRRTATRLSQPSSEVWEL